MYYTYLRNFNLNIIFVDDEDQSCLIALQMLTKLLHFCTKKGNGKGDIFFYTKS